MPRSRRHQHRGADGELIRHRLRAGRYSGLDARRHRKQRQPLHPFASPRDREFLYPSKWQWQSIRNRYVIESLTKHGDDLSKSRRVFHWLYFSAEADWEQCAAAARAKGFSTIRLEKSDQPDEARPWGLELHRIDSVSPADIDAVGYEMVTLAQDHSGEYEGWEAQPRPNSCGCLR